MSTKGLVVSVLLGCLGVAMAPSGAVAAIPTSSSTATERVPAAGLTFVPGSTRKVEQLVGDLDLETKRPTVSRTEKRFGIGGTDLGSSFEHEGKLFFLFGDTVSRGGGGDAIATTAAQSGEAGVRLDFVTGADGKWLKVRPPGIDMGAVEVPLAGVSVGGEIYLMVKTNHTARASTDISKLVRFDERARRFEVLRDVSRLPAGHFVHVSLRHETAPIAGLPGPGPSVLMWGAGTYRKSNPYFAVTPAETWATGDGTRYFAGLDAAGEPTWAADESSAAPLFEQPEIGDLSVSFVPRTRSVAHALRRLARPPGRPASASRSGRRAAAHLRPCRGDPGARPSRSSVSSTPGRASSSTWPIPTTGSSGRASAPTARAGGPSRARPTPLTSSSASPGSRATG